MRLQPRGEHSAANTCMAARYCCAARSLDCAAARNGCQAGPAARARPHPPSQRASLWMTQGYPADNLWARTEGGVEELPGQANLLLLPLVPGGPSHQLHAAEQGRSQAGLVARAVQGSCSRLSQAQTQRQQHAVQRLCPAAAPAARMHTPPSVCRRTVMHSRSALRRGKPAPGVCTATPALT